MRESAKPYKTKKMDLAKLIPNPNNPRKISEEKFKKLIQSIKDDPWMLEYRPIVVNKQMMIIGGNQRYRACLEAGLKQAPVIIADDLDSKEEIEFILKDNIYVGKWDSEILLNLFSKDELFELGLDTSEFIIETIEQNLSTEYDTSDLKNKHETYLNNENKQVVLYFPEDIYEKVNNSIEIFKQKEGIKEMPEILLKLIELWKAEYVNS